MKLSTEGLHRRFVEALGDAVLWHSTLKEKPLGIDLTPPLPGKLRAYLYNATRPPGGRTLGEHKIQLIVPGQPRGQAGNFDYSDGRIVLLAGYQPEDDVFILWEADMYRDFPYSRNVQAKPETVAKAISGVVARQRRRLWGQVEEIVLACQPALLAEAIRERIDITRRRLVEGGV